MPARTALRRWILLITMTVAVATAVATATWLALSRDPNPDRLAEMSAIGEAFGTISAALSAIALIGIATSLYFQRQQTQVARIEASRAMRMQLMQLALGRPRYLAAWGFDLSDDSERNSEIAYTSMVFAYLKMSYVLGVLTDFELTGSCRIAFQQDSVVNFWRGGREVYLRDSSSTGRRFARLVDEVYAAVSLEPRPVPSETPVRPDAGSSNARLTLKAFRSTGVAVAIGVSFGLVWRAISTRRTAGRRSEISGRKDRS